MKNYKSEINSVIEKIDFDTIKDHPNILIAAGFWEEERYGAAKICYRFMRKIDDLIDDRKSIGSISVEERTIFISKVNNWINCLNELSSSDPFVDKVRETICRFQIPAELFANFSRSMIYDITHNGFSTFDEFISYAEGASVAPAAVFVHLCCLNKSNGQYYPPEFHVTKVARPCALFSYLVHIIRDFQKDQKNNLNYFALDILKKNNLIPGDLKKIAHGARVTRKFRNVIREYYDQAEKYKQETLTTINEIKDQLEERYILSLNVIFDLYLQVFERIDIENGNFTAEELTPTFSEIKERVLSICG
ncbi:MAG: squalene/phytoene synthase family protein [Bacteroidales bacterium]|jgi:phytoene synthase